MSDELEPLPDLPELHDLEPIRAGPAASAPGQRPPLRVLDKAPQHLRLAALIVVCGSVLPWMPGKVEGAAGSAWLMTLLAKAIMGGAAWLWLQQVYHDFGPKLQGALGQLANLQPLRKKEAVEEDSKQRRAKPKTPTTHLVHPFPTGLHLLAFLLAAAAVAVAWNDPRRGLIGSNGVPEVLMLGWAAFTWVHIANYERWGGFNPLFPLMFLGMLFAGAAAVVGALGGAATGMTKLLGLAGGAAVAGGGGLAAYTIAEAMMAAKKEGDRKKAEALEARKAARGKKDRDS
jgi:hypothetical protein